jgi:pyruvate-formate lyase
MAAARASRSGLAPIRCTAATVMARVVPVGRKAPYRDALDGISYTVSVAPQKAHLSDEELVDGAVKAFDTYFDQGGFHMNLNVLDKETLEDAMKNPDKYP